MFVRRAHRLRQFSSFLVLASFSFAAAPVDEPLLAAAQRLAPIFYPPATTHAVLSPDGNKAAFDLRRDGQLLIVTIDVDRPTEPVAEIAIDADELVARHGNRALSLAYVNELRWTNEHRLALAYGAPQADGSRRHVLHTFDFNGGNPTTLFDESRDIRGLNFAGFIREPTPRFVWTIPGGERWIVDLDTGRVSKLRNPKSKAVVELDRVLRLELESSWTSPGAESAYAFLRETWPDSTFTLFPASATSDRLVARVDRPDRPGRFILLDATERRLWKLADDAPSFAQRKIEYHAFDFEDQVERFRGFVATPVYSPTERAPVILRVLRPSDREVFTHYDPLTAALNAMGFAVVALQSPADDTPDRELIFAGRPLPYRFIRHPESRPSRPATKDSIANAQRERFPTIEQNEAELKHQLRGLDLLATRFGLSRTAAAVFSEGDAGRRALLLHAYAPGRFRCLILHGMPLHRFSQAQDSEWLRAVLADSQFHDTFALITRVAWNNNRTFLRKLTARGIDCQELVMQDLG